VVEILRSFKDVPKLYTLLDIPGFEDKIANDVDMKRASQLHTQARAEVKAKNWQEALALTHQSLAITPQTHSLNTLAEILTELGLAHIKDAQLTSGRELLETAYDKEVLPFPDSPRFVSTIIKNAAFEAQQQERSQLAVDLFETLQTHDQLDALSWYAFAMALKALGRAQDSHTHLKRALEVDAHNYFALLELGFQAQQRGEFSEALEFIAAALDNVPAGHQGETLRALYNAQMAYGDALKDAGDPLRALAQFKAAGKIEPVAASGAAAAAVTAAYAQYYFAQLQLGHQAQLRGEFPLALDFITVAMNNEPAANQGEARRILYNAHIAFGDALRKSGDAAQALERFGIAREFEPVDGQGGAAAGQYYSLLDLGYKTWGEDMPRALTFFSRALELATPEQCVRLKEIIASLNGQLQREDGFVKQRTGRYREAIAAFEQALLNIPGDPDIYFSYGVSLKRMQRFHEAETMLTKAIAERPTHYWAMMELGYLQIRSGNRPKALEFFLRAKEIAPSDRPGHCQKFILLASRESRLARGN
jgi:tetratricopeptide (TPR) repeat protein